MLNMKRQPPFQRIALMSRLTPNIKDTLLPLIDHLQAQGRDIVLEQQTAELLSNQALPRYHKKLLAQHSDLLIMVGGDGSLLRAARAAAPQNLPVVGINRGRLGFLTDIHPKAFSKLNEVINGHYIEESRFLLNVEVTHEGKTITKGCALNDIILLRGDIVRMIEFDIYIDQEFVCAQRSDGLIVSTPTGSTAYALSGGGPILHPNIDALVLVPMFAHTLSNRPLVIQGDSKLRIDIIPQNSQSLGISRDGQQRIPIPTNSQLHISKLPQKLRLIHPLDYRYFDTLRNKLHWARKHTA